MNVKQVVMQRVGPPQRALLRYLYHGIWRQKLARTGHRDFDNFLVVGHARTGSNYLLAGLKSSSQIRVHGEIFAAHNREIGRRFGWAMSPLRTGQAAGVRLVGAKVFYYHLTEDEWAQLASDRRITKVVHLTRGNKLRTLVSLEIARVTDEWRQTGAAKPNERVKAELNTATLLDSIREIERQEETARHRLAQTDMIELVYENLVSNPAEQFGRLAEFLGIDDIDPGAIALRKQNPGPVSDLIANYDEVRAVLGATEYKNYLD